MMLIETEIGKVPGADPENIEKGEKTGDSGPLFFYCCKTLHNINNFPTPTPLFYLTLVMQKESKFWNHD